MEYDKKTVMAQCENDRLQRDVNDLKSERRLRAQFIAAPDRADFIKVAKGDEERAFENFCKFVKQHE